MVKDVLKSSSFLIITLVVVLGLSLSLQSLYANLASPTDDPPSNNLALPVFNDSTDSDLVNWPVVGHNLGITGSLSVTGNIFMSGGRITGVATPEIDTDAANRSYASDQIGDPSSTSCDSYVVYDGVPYAFCAPGEKYIVGGCRTMLGEQTLDFPVMVGYPVIKTWAEDEPGWACSYEARIYNTSPTLWQGPYDAHAYVMCCRGPESEAPTPTYECTGSLPIANIECPGDQTDLTETLAFQYVGNSVSYCTDARKCEYYSLPLICSGEDIANATMCPGADINLTVSAYKFLADSCTGAKCEMTCDSGYTRSGSVCIPNTAYACTGTSFANATMCSGDNTNLTANTLITLVDSCTSGTKCEMTCNTGYYRSGSTCVPITYSCTGSSFANATMCSGDDTGLSYNTVKSLVDNCSFPAGTSPKCEMTCNAGYIRSGSTCVPVVYSCTGTDFTNATMCTGDDSGLTADTSKTLVDSCTVGTKCEMACNSGYVRSGSTCVPESYSCTGSDFANSVVCFNDDQGLSTDWPKVLVDVCSVHSSAYYPNSSEPKCQMTCAAGYYRSGTDCLPFTCGNNFPYDGESYPTVQIGSQCWFAKNLNVGTWSPAEIYVYDNDDVEKICYDSLASNCTTYGGLYNRSEAMNYMFPGSVCPTGWHLPTEDDVNILLNSAGTTDEMRYNNLIVGGSTGFNALFGGRKWTDIFLGLGEFGWYQMDHYNEFMFIGTDIYGNDEAIISGVSHDALDGYYMSVRCIQD